MKLLIKSAFFMALLYCMGCNPIDRTMLVNNWKAEAILFNGAPSELDPAQVRLHIRSDGTFSYTDMIGNSQNGTFRTNKMGVLYLQPADGFEKAWQVVTLTPDSLVLKIENLTKKYEMILVPDN